jgi:dTDP-glucose pyrophosphorylase
MNILIPMAGAGSRFQSAGYTFPKPLVEVTNGKPMIQEIVENLNAPDCKHIFVVQQEHYDRYALKYLLNLISPKCEIVIINEMTEGAACTTLLARALINTDEPLIIANSDQIVRWPTKYDIVGTDSLLLAGGTEPGSVLESLTNIGDGTIYTFHATHPKWSFARLTNSMQVLEVAEKRPISRTATVGIYHWGKGSDYVKYAEQMIDKKVRVNGEFYVCPVYNEAIQDGKYIKAVDVPGMWGIGTPEDLNKYLSANENHSNPGR